MTENEKLQNEAIKELEALKALLLEHRQYLKALEEETDRES